MNVGEIRELQSTLNRIDQRLQQIASEMEFQSVLQAASVAKQNGIPVSERILGHLRSRVGQ